MAQAAPDVQGSSTIAEPNGAYTAVKTVKVYSATNPDNPAPVAGKFTYVYTINNDPSSLICLTGFDLEAPLGSVSGAGFINGPGIDPSATQVGQVNGKDVVEWDFDTPNICPGDTSDELTVHSAYSPGTATDNVVSLDGQFALDAPGTCIGPFTPPQVVGEPLPCTIGFWKNRADGKQGTEQWFPDGDFTSVVDAAVALSNGVFTSGTQLLASLTSKGQRTTEERAKQQLAALLLNLAAGDLFADNQKCKLFEGNDITSNQCGDNLTIGAALAQIFGNLAGGLSCADDINNGIGVVQ